MITTRIIPVSTATSQEFLIEIKEKLCKQYCTNSTRKPVATVAFSTGEVRVLNGNAIVPVTATVTVLLPLSDKCGCVAPEVFTETFDVAFAATATNVPTLTPGAETTVEGAFVTCGKARGIELTTSLTVALA